MDEFALPEAKVVTGPRGWKVRVAAHALLWLFVVAILYAIVPKFEAIFRDFGVPLPAATVSVLGASHLVVRFWILVPLLFAAGVAIDGSVQLAWQTDPKRRGLADAWNTAAVVLPLAALGLLVVAVFLPLITLITKLSG